MLREQALVWSVVGVPLLGSLLLPLFGRLSPGLRNWAALAMVLFSFAGVLALLPAVDQGLVIPAAAADFTWFQADRLAVFMALVSTGVGAVIVLYSHGYIAHYPFQNEYYFMVVLFLGAMMGLVFSQNLILLFVFWEITSLACWRLIGFFRREPCVLRADKAFLVTVFGALLMLLGFIMIHSQTGSFDLGVIRNAARVKPVSNLAVLLILFGILSKSATLPMHTWLPDAGVAPSPVTALLHAAVLVKIGVYVYARLFAATFAVPEIWQVVVPAIAGVSALVAGGAALIETDLKRIIAYSTVSQIGFILLGLAVGGEIGLGGGLLYILMHGISKGGLFLCAGIVEQKTGERDITKLGGLIKSMPVTAFSFILCAFSVMGLPPFGGFFSKYMVMVSVFQQGQFWTGLIFLAGACLTIIYLLRVFAFVFLGVARSEHKLAAEGGMLMVGSAAFLGLLSLLSGPLVGYPAAFLSAAVRQMAG